MTISDFILQRVAEDEAAARAAEASRPAPWRATHGREVKAQTGHLVTPEDEHSEEDEPPSAQALHVARHDPTRVLAECESKRAIVQAAREYRAEAGAYDDMAEREYERVLRALAKPYADHPDFDPAWSA